jgi:hypothetical protein
LGVFAKSRRKTGSFEQIRLQTGAFHQLQNSWVCSRYPVERRPGLSGSSEPVEILTGALP